MSKSLEGACLCGRLTFNLRDPEVMAVCHCTRCQRWTGTGSATVLVVDKKNFEITKGRELLKPYKEEGFSERAFCSNCGSSLYAVGDDKLYVGAGLFRGGHDLKPAFHMQVAAKAPWEEIADKTPQFPEWPSQS